jgi:hypothetical protein
MPTDLGSIQGKVSNFSRSKPGSKRERVLKKTPKRNAGADTSNVTTPDVTGLLPIPIVGTSVPTVGASGTTLPTGNGKKGKVPKSRKKELVTPLAYAQILCGKLDILAKKTDSLKGKRLFYTGGDMQYASQSTKKKMELVGRSPCTRNPWSVYRLYPHFSPQSNFNQALELTAVC